MEVQTRRVKPEVDVYEILARLIIDYEGEANEKDIVTVDNTSSVNVSA